MELDPHVYLELGRVMVASMGNDTQSTYSTWEEKSK